MATGAALPWLRGGSFLSMAHTRRLQGDGNWLANAQLLGALWGRLDAEHQPRPLLLAIDDGRGEFGLCRDEIDAGSKPAGATVAAHPNAVADVDFRQCRLRHEEAHPR